MTAADLAKLLCRDLVFGVYERGGRTFVSTRFAYPGGDLVNLYVSAREGRTVVSDMGATHFLLTAAGIEFTEARRHFIQSICALHDVSFEQNALWKAIDATDPGRDVIALCQAVSQVATLRYEVQGRQYPSLNDEVETLVVAKIEPFRRVDRDWTDLKLDPKSAHQVDYHLNSTPDPRNIFVVTTAEKAEKVTAIARFWEPRRPAKTLSILRPGIELPTKLGNRLYAASPFVMYGVKGHENDIVKFALSESTATEPTSGG